MMPMMPVVVVSGAISRRFGAVVANRVMTASQPPKAIMPTTGTRTMARNIMQPWMKSVQQTAMKPPRKV